jgi:hypothetical protein
MTLLTRIAGAAAAAALVIGGVAPAQAQEPLDDLARHLSAQSQALNQVLERLSQPETARAVVDSAVRGDRLTFEGLFEGIEVQVPNKCVWVADTVEKLTSKFVGFEERCRRRADLTLDEWLIYVLITHKHFPPVQSDEPAPPTVTQVEDLPVIPPGPYLDELKANGLVRCELAKKYSGGISLFPGKPEKFCFVKP